MSLTPFSASSLPANQIWDRGQAPVERLTALKSEVDRFEGEAFAVLEQPTASAEDRAAVSGKLKEILRGVYDSQPAVFPPLDKDAVARQVGFKYYYANTARYRDEQPVNETLVDACNELYRLHGDVMASIDKPGPVSQEKEGLIFRHPVADKLHKRFAQISQDLAQAAALAQVTRTDGPQAQVEGPGFGWNQR